MFRQVGTSDPKTCLPRVLSGLFPTGTQASSQSWCGMRKFAGLQPPGTARGYLTSPFAISGLSKGPAISARNKSAMRGVQPWGGGGRARFDWFCRADFPASWGSPELPFVPLRISQKGSWGEPMSSGDPRPACPVTEPAKHALLSDPYLLLPPPRATNGAVIGLGSPSSSAGGKWNKKKRN